MIQSFPISRDEAIYESFPDVAKTPGGDLLCVFSECTHHGDRAYTRIVARRSTNRGRSWGEKRAITEPRYQESPEETYWNCPRISRVGDDRLTIVVDEICDKIDDGTRPIERNWLLLSEDNGETWSDPIDTPVEGIVPDRLLELETGPNRGRWVLSAHTVQEEGDGPVYVERTWWSDDRGETWSGPATVAADPDRKLCEGNVVELPDGELVCFLRENSGTGQDCFTAISEDGGESWDGVYRLPIPACHRPVGGVLESGRVLVTHRHMQGGFGFGSWTQNTFAALTDVESCLARNREDAWARLIPVAHDRSRYADLGYTGWVQFDDGEVYVVDYIVDDAPAVSVREPSGYDGEYRDRPKAQIRGYAFDESDLVIDA